MPLLELTTGSTLGAVLGMRHALEPDHLAAVSTLVAGERRSIRAVFLGVCWGLGHTAALVAVGTIVIALRAELPERLTDFFELGVALMLIALGTQAIRRAARQGPAGPAALHQHGPIVHRHPGVSKHVHVAAHMAHDLARRRLPVNRARHRVGSAPSDALDLLTSGTGPPRIT